MSQIDITPTLIEQLIDHEGIELKAYKDTAYKERSLNREMLRAIKTIVNNIGIIETSINSVIILFNLFFIVLPSIIYLLKFTLIIFKNHI